MHGRDASRSYPVFSVPLRLRGEIPLFPVLFSVSPCLCGELPLYGFGSLPIMSGSGGNGLCGSAWYQYATEE